MERIAKLVRAAASSAALCVVVAVVLSAQTLTTIYSFCSHGNCEDGQSPLAGLVQASDGNLYGTTCCGGKSSKGTVFRITTGGALTSLYSFCSLENCADGQSPLAGLVQASDGNLYGTTNAGGLFASYGTVFRITLNGALTSLYSFCSQNGCPDGNYPGGALVQASDGNLYGTTPEGGLTGVGTVFKIAPSGALATLYSFCPQRSCTDSGSVPNGGLVQASDGNLYGTTSGNTGGVFKITTTGALTSLYTFCSVDNCPDGEYPVAGLVQASDGNFYGTTDLGGPSRAGSVFKITPSGLLTTLHLFCSQANCPDGQNPQAPLVQAGDGNFYGTTTYGGSSGQGTVFRITPGGALTTLYSFCSESNCSDGANPVAGLVQAGDGNLYGTTAGSAETGSGTVFRLNIGLPGGPSISSGGVVNAASYATGGVAPGSIASAFGSFLLSPPATAANVPLPMALSGLSMEFGGRFAAPLYFVSGAQVNLQVPWELAGQSQTMLVADLNSQTGPTQAVQLTAYAPGIFSTNAEGTLQGAILDTSYQLVDASNPATAGTYILIYCTGLGAVTNQPLTGSIALSDPLSWTVAVPTITIGGVKAGLQFWGLAPGFVGLYQNQCASARGGVPGIGRARGTFHRRRDIKHRDHCDPVTLRCRCGTAAARYSR